jgi:hypothetical protein
LVSLPENQLSTEQAPIIHDDTDRDEDNGEVPSIPTSPSTVQAPIDTFMEIEKTGHSKTGEISRGARERRLSPQQPIKDLVSQGLISLESAEMLVKRYFSQLDHSLYGIASRYTSLDDVRQASTALLTAICTVSALHDPDDEKLYEVCIKEFRRIVSTSIFEKRDIEYLRALCIGSFWLPDDSRILTSDAVRRAADVRLHGYFYQVVNTNKIGAPSVDHAISQEEARDRMRLWYIIFICDQHLSILHNRDGLLRHDKNVLEMWDTYLESEGGNETDTRITSQVSILLISNAVRDAFMSDHQEQVHKSLVVQLNHFSRQLNDWFLNIATLYSESKYQL